MKTSAPLVVGLGIVILLWTSPLGADIGDVTIIDNLTTRLEYVPDTAQCSIPAAFSTQVNEGDSLVLRWEITDPLEPGEGGVIRFDCRVR